MYLILYNIFVVAINTNNLNQSCGFLTIKMNHDFNNHVNFKPDSLIC